MEGFPFPKCYELASLKLTLSLLLLLQAANAQAALAYQLYQKKFSGPRWEALVKKGAKKQRLLWASTSVKNPAYPDTLYVAPLIGPDTVCYLILITLYLVFCCSCGPSEDIGFHIRI